MKRAITILLINVVSIGITYSQIISEEVLIKNDSIELPGTLSFSKKQSKLIIWIHGSENVDRNGN